MIWTGKNERQNFFQEKTWASESFFFSRILKISWNEKFPNQNLWEEYFLKEFSSIEGNTLPWKISLKSFWWSFFHCENINRGNWFQISEIQWYQRKKNLNSDWMSYQCFPSIITILFRTFEKVLPSLNKSKNPFKSESFLFSKFRIQSISKTLEKYWVFSMASEIQVTFEKNYKRQLNAYFFHFCQIQENGFFLFSISSNCEFSLNQEKIKFFLLHFEITLDSLFFLFLWISL